MQCFFEHLYFILWHFNVMAPNVFVILWWFSCLIFLANAKKITKACNTVPCNSDVLVFGSTRGLGRSWNKGLFKVELRGPYFGYSMVQGHLHCIKTNQFVYFLSSGSLVDKRLKAWWIVAVHSSRSFFLELIY